MKRLHKLTQQRRRQLHVHLPPSGLDQVTYQTPWQRHKVVPLQPPARQSETTVQAPAPVPAFVAQQQTPRAHSVC